MQDMIRIAEDIYMYEIRVYFALEHIMSNVRLQIPQS